MRLTVHVSDGDLFDVDIVGYIKLEGQFLCFGMGFGRGFYCDITEVVLGLICA